MNRLKLYRLLCKQDELKNARHPMLEKNRFMMFLGIFMWLYYAAILLFLGVMLSIGMKNAYNGVAAFHVLDGGLIYILITDFWARAFLQQSPSQRIRPYTLLPIRRSFLLHMYLVRSGFSLGSLYWMFMFVPFGLIAVYPLLGWGGLFGWLLGWWIMCIIDGYIYLMVRTLCMKHAAWWLLPVAVHAALLCIMLIPDKNMLDMPCTQLMYDFALGKVWVFLLAIAIIALFYWLCYRVQGVVIYNEISKEEDTTVKSTTQFNFLNRYGRLGQYLKLEIKLRLRNKTLRYQFIMAMVAVLILSGILFFTEVYDAPFMKSFICLYDYLVPSTLTLVCIMCHEGNYIDGLMSRRNSIYQLLCAKYVFNAFMTLIPAILLIPLMVTGKISVWMNLGYLFFTQGVVVPLLFQLAVYNNNTLPLNVKITGSKQGNTMQQVVSIVALFVPIGIENLGRIAFGPVWGYAPMVVLGVMGILTMPLWLGNTYKRMMARRYINMEGFRATRND
ncbi:MAG: DUF5687 family protein [Bacteroidaceae bacterium]